VTFKLPAYNAPDLNSEIFRRSPNVKLAAVKQSGVAPQNFHATTIFPEYFKINGKWALLSQSRMDCVVVVRGKNRIEATEFRRLRRGDRVVVGRSEDAGEGIYVHTAGFKGKKGGSDLFAFRTGRSRETSYSRDYDRLYEILRHEKKYGYVVWVLGPAVVFDSDSRNAMVNLAQKGYVHAILAGNALAAHDLEGALFKTALGQDIYTQECRPNGHYHHLEAINRARKYSSLEKFTRGEKVRDGVIHACHKKHIPFVLAGSIRDDGPLPGVVPDVYTAQDLMRAHTRKATTVLGLATQLHSIATGNMTPAYQVVNGIVRPVYIYSVDVSEFAVNKLRDRGTLEVTSIVTNIQDFLVNLGRNLE
jgi:lysine-ketoglutarate reductase/saccharopine dehydrogenase-like protein (TIGR00300 family)